MAILQLDKSWNPHILLLLKLQQVVKTLKEVCSSFDFMKVLLAQKPSLTFQSGNSWINSQTYLLFVEMGGSIKQEDIHAPYVIKIATHVPRMASKRVIVALLKQSLRFQKMDLLHAYFVTHSKDWLFLIQESANNSVEME